MIRFSEASFEAIAQTATDSILISDEHSIIVFANRKACETFGYPEVELVGAHMTMLMPEKYRNGHNRGMERFIKTGSPNLIGHTIEIEGLRKDGTVFPLELSLSSWKENNSYFFSGIIRDTTKRKQAIKEKEELSRNLQLQKNELETMYEELQASEEELRAANEELYVTTQSLKDLNDTLEKKVALRTLQIEEQRAWLHNLFMQVPGLIGILKGRNGVISLSNPTFNKLWGKRDIIGKEMRDAWPELEGQGYFEIVEKVFDTGEPHFSNEYPGKIDIHNNEDLKLHFFNLAFVPHKNLSGETEGVLIYGVDVTEQVETKRAIVESEEQIRLITDALPVLITYVDKEEKYRFNNKAYEDWFNKPRTQVYGKPIKEILGDEVYDSIKNTIKKVFQGESLSLKTKILKYNEGLKHVSIDFIPHLKEGKVIGYYAVTSDISDHVKARQDLQRANEEINAAYAEVKSQREKLYDLFMQAPAFVAVAKGNDFVYELANPHYLKMIKSETPIEGKSLAEVLPHLDPAVKEVLDDVYNNGKRFIGNEFPVVDDWDKDGVPYTKYFNVIYEPIKEKSSKVSGIMAFGYEVTEQVKARKDLEINSSLMKEMNEDLIKKNEELRKLNVDLDNFIYTASHDLKSPAVNLEGLVSLLKKELNQQIDVKGRNVIEMIETSIHKLYKTIIDLTEITKVQRDIEGDRKEISFSEVLEEVITGIHSQLENPKEHFHLDIQVEKLFFNRNNLRSVLYNLISNAIKYQSPDRKLKIVVSSLIKEESIFISIEDNGLGIATHQQPKLFSMFKRLHTHVEGTGIGLYIIKRIVENNGGRILVVSQENEGSTFTVILPLKY